MSHETERTKSRSLPAARKDWASQSRWQWPEKAPTLSFAISMKRLCPTRRKKSKPWAENAVGVRCAVSSSQSVGDMYEQIVKRFGTLHILVNNAALVQTGEANEENRTKRSER